MPTAPAEPGSQPVLTRKAVLSKTPSIPSGKASPGPSETKSPAGERAGVEEPGSLLLASPAGLLQRARSDAARYKLSKETVSSRTGFLGNLWKRASGARLSHHTICCFLKPSRRIRHWEAGIQPR